MKEYVWSLGEIATKADDEGGLFDFMFGYKSKDSSFIPTDTEDGRRFKELWEKAYEMEPLFEEMREILDNHFEEGMEEQRKWE